MKPGYSVLLDVKDKVDKWTNVNNAIHTLVSV